MRSLIAPAAMILSLAVGSAAFAATPAPAAKTMAKPAAMAKADTKTKTAACEQSWKAQKTHTGKEADFVKACVAKG